jgi:hypothetical protein
MRTGILIYLVTASENAQALGPPRDRATDTWTYEESRDKFWYGSASLSCTEVRAGSGARRKAGLSLGGLLLGGAPRRVFLTTVQEV